jgi:hypothetical protein
VWESSWESVAVGSESRWESSKDSRGEKKEKKGGRVAEGTKKPTNHGENTREIKKTTTKLTFWGRSSIVVGELFGRVEAFSIATDPNSHTLTHNKKREIRALC